MKKFVLAIVIAAAVVVLAALGRFAATHDFYGPNGIEVPDAKIDYIGAWTAPDHVLNITALGKLHYEGQDGIYNVKLDLPIQKFDGDDFIVGALFWATTFHVTAPPHKEADAWHMTSDGVDYTRPHGRT